MGTVPQWILDNTPALGAPSGQVNNLVNPSSLFAVDLVSCYVSLALVLVLFGVRVYTKACLLKQWYIEDYNCAVALALLIAFCGVLIWSAYVGGGRHQWNTSFSMAFNLAYIGTIGEAVYAIAQLFSKVSLLQQVRRIFGFSTRGKRGVVNLLITSLIWMNILFYIISSALVTFACNPRAAAWDLLVQGRCINTTNVAIVSSGINVLSDISVLLIPVYCTWRLSLPLRRRVGLVVIFGFGGFTCAVSLVRLIDTAVYLPQQDKTYYLLVVGLLAEAEVAMAIMCSCMPFVPRFVQHLRGRRGTKATTNSYDYYAPSKPSRQREVLPSAASKTDSAAPTVKGRSGILRPNDEEMGAPKPRSIPLLPRTRDSDLCLPIAHGFELDASQGEEGAVQVYPSPVRNESHFSFVSELTTEINTSDTPITPEISRTASAHSTLAGSCISPSTPSYPAKALIHARPYNHHSPSSPASRCARNERLASRYTYQTPLDALHAASILWDRGAGSQLSASASASASAATSSPTGEARSPSLTDRVKSSRSEHAMRALSGRYWRDSPEPRPAPRPSRYAPTTPGPGSGATVTGR